MKTHTMKLAFTGLAAALALGVPGISLASDHILIVKTAPAPGGSVTTTNGVVTSAGSVTTPITIAVTGVNSGNAVTYGAGQTLVVQTLPKVKMCKPGTGGNLEWLDQGLSVIGATGTLNSATPTNNQNNFIHRLVLSQTGLTDNYSSSNGSCSAVGSLSYSVTRTAVIESRNGNSVNFNLAFTGIFSFGNVLGSGPGGVPEPGTISLIGLGLAVLGWMSVKRVRKVRAHTV